MRYFFSAIILCLSFIINIQAQDINQITEDGTISKVSKSDSTQSDKEIPVGMYVWTIDERFGDIKPSEPDTLQHLFMNDIFTYGRHGEYNTTGNLAAPRISRIFIDRPEPDQFIFTQPYDYFITPVDKLKFINTLSPITNITYQSGGGKTNGIDRLKAIFGVNAGKKAGMGLKFDYMYGRGHYANQNTSHFNTTLFGSYLGDKYDMHIIMSANHEKVTENGGITDDDYITHPESFSSFSSDEIPTVLEENWNRNNNQHLFFTQRYNIGFTRKVKMTDAEIKARQFAIESAKENKGKEKGEKGKKDKRGGNGPDMGNGEKPNLGRPEGAIIAGDEKPDTAFHPKKRISVSTQQQKDSLLVLDKAKEDSSMTKNEFVPVTSFIHTLELNSYDRIYEAYQTPDNYYANTYYSSSKLGGDSIYDETRNYSIKNTFAIALLEGFNKYAKAGLKAFITSDFRHFTMPDSTGTRDTYNEHSLSIGGQLSKTQGSFLHYNIIAETFIAGEDIGQLKLDATGDLNFHLFNDTIQLAAKAFVHRLNPTFFYRHYHSQHLWWDNELNKEIRTRIEGLFSLKRTKTSLRVAVEELKNYTYFAQDYDIDATTYDRTGNTVTVNQCNSPINVLTASLNQDFKLGLVIWENEITYQKSSNNDALPLPKISLYSNLYLEFKIAKVLCVDLGGDVRYFSKYYALDYSPAISQFCVQNSADKVQIGNYPIINLYANMQLKHTRFYVMMSHVNCGSGNSSYFLVPHYPIDPMVLLTGISWNFFN